MRGDTIHVVVTCRNAAPWVSTCIESLKAQSWDRFSCVVVDDASTDGTAEEVNRAAAGDSRFRLISLPQRVWACRARMIGIEQLTDAEAHEVVALIDGDDWLCDAEVLAVIHAAHHDRRLLVTYGGYLLMDGRLQQIPEYPLSVKLAGAFRKCAWYAMPVRSFRFGLWRHVRQDALRDSAGRYYRKATDQAVFLPLLELAGTKSGSVRRPQYVYNRQTPYNCDKVDLDGQARASHEIKHKTAHAPLPRADMSRLLGPRSE